MTYKKWKTKRGEKEKRIKEWLRFSSSTDWIEQDKTRSIKKKFRFPIGNSNLKKFKSHVGSSDFL